MYSLTFNYTPLPIPHLQPPHRQNQPKRRAPILRQRSPYRRFLQIPYQTIHIRARRGHGQHLTTRRMELEQPWVRQPRPGPMRGKRDHWRIRDEELRKSHALGRPEKVRVWCAVPDRFQVPVQLPELVVQVVFQEERVRGGVDAVARKRVCNAWIEHVEDTPHEALARREIRVGWAGELVQAVRDDVGCFGRHAERGGGITPGFALGDDVRCVVEAGDDAAVPVAVEDALTEVREAARGALLGEPAKCCDAGRGKEGSDGRSTGALGLQRGEEPLK